MSDMKKDIFLSIVIPVYQSEKIVHKLVSAILLEMRSLGLETLFELILVDDRSPDESWIEIKQLAEKYKFILAVSLMRNVGQHNAIMAGLNYASGEIIVLMDDDLQHNPAIVGEMINALQRGPDVCYVKYVNRKHAVWKKMGSRFNDLMATILIGKPSDLYFSSLKALKRSVVNEIIKYKGPYVYLDGLIIDITQSTVTIEINHQDRADGIGNYNLRKSLRLWLSMVTGFSIMPLRIATIVGLSFSILSFVMVISIVIIRLSNSSIQAGWASVLVAIIFIGGIQLACIGLVGEYVGRAYLSIRGRPQFVIKEILDSNLFAKKKDD